MIIVQSENNRLSAIIVLVNNRSFMVINVYISTNKDENLTLFTEYHGEMYVMITNSDIESVFVLGDFNAPPVSLLVMNFYNFALSMTWVEQQSQKKKIASLPRRVRGSPNSLLQVVARGIKEFDNAVLVRFNELHVTRVSR